jgi:hypothetical protein
VVACELRALREVLDTRVTFVAPGDLRALVEQAQSARRPVQPPPPWTWQDAARATWKVYQQAATQPDGLPSAHRGLRSPHFRGKRPLTEPQ